MHDGLSTIAIARRGSLAHAGHDPAAPLIPVTGIPGLDRAPACCVTRSWIVVLDGDRLRRARVQADISRRELARRADISPGTISRLERQARPHCHFRTRARIAAALGTHPQSITADTTSRPQAPSTLQPRDSQDLHVSTFSGRPDAIAQVRQFARRVLGDIPVAEDAILICSELAANAVLHTRSAAPGGHFTVGAAIRPRDHAWIEVQDQGGRWTHKLGTSNGRGLAIVDFLASCWDIRGDEAGRTICAQLNLPS